ncbi:hypothetical protein M5689_004082 [Euphorbia peplus]|nr:hypothetical protein M5689_004082 [Euphorbia peplus]
MDKDSGEGKRRMDKDSGEGRSKKVRSDKDKDDATEEQVEEFFAILRRMQVAVKYFEKENGEGWRAALEAEVGGGCDGGDKAEETQIGVEDKRPIVEEETVILDLNSIPAAETHEL